METFGEQLRRYRTEQKLPLRAVAAFLDIDQAILSKIETGTRRAARNQVLKLAEFFEIDSTDLLVTWLSDNLVYELQDEDLALKALELAEEVIAYKEFKKVDRQKLINLIKEEIRKFPAIEKAWIYGSFAKGDDGPKSDIDIAIKTSEDFTYFDLAEVQHQLESIVDRKIDVGFIDSFKPYVFDHVKSDLKVIYEK
ncbi:MAG: nucleotidyltransferase domain-containing protein [Bacteroidota bacterium]